MKSSSVEQLILELFARHSTEEAHFTAQDVYHQIKPRLPAVNQSTVYRALERMTHAGKVSVSDMGVGAAVYEIVGGEHHHHLICQDCGKVTTINNTAIQALFRSMAKQYEFEVMTNHLILFGRCAQCRQKAS
ncbi:MAG: Fur family transcriptional regulator [Chloroflexota bacterium]